MGDSLSYLDNLLAYCINKKEERKMKTFLPKGKEDPYCQDERGDCESH